MLVSTSHMLVAVAFLGTCALCSAEDVCRGSSCAEEASMSEFSLLQSQVDRNVVISPVTRTDSDVTTAEDNLPKDSYRSAGAAQNTAAAIEASGMSTETTAAWNKALSDAIMQFEQAFSGKFDHEFVNALHSTALGSAPMLKRPPNQAETEAMLAIVAVAEENMAESRGISSLVAHAFMEKLLGLPEVHSEGNLDVNATAGKKISVGQHLEDALLDPSDAMQNVNQAEVSLLQSHLELQSPVRRREPDVIAAEDNLPKELDLPAPAMQHADGASEASDMSKVWEVPESKALFEAIMQFEQSSPGKFDDDFVTALHSFALGMSPMLKRPPNQAEKEAIMTIVSIAQEKMAESKGIPSSSAQAFMDHMLTMLKRSF